MIAQWHIFFAITSYVLDCFAQGYLLIFLLDIWAFGEPRIIHFLSNGIFFTWITNPNDWKI